MPSDCSIVLGRAVLPVVVDYECAIGNKDRNATANIDFDDGWDYDYGLYYNNNTCDHLLAATGSTLHRLLSRLLLMRFHHFAATM